jgi:hypothetical protein
MLANDASGSDEIPATARIAGADAEADEEANCAAPCVSLYWEGRKQAAAQLEANLGACPRRFAMSLLRRAGFLAFLTLLVWVGRDLYVAMFRFGERSLARLVAVAGMSWLALCIGVERATQHVCPQQARSAEKSAILRAHADVFGCCAPCDHSDCQQLMEELLRTEDEQ